MTRHPTPASPPPNFGAEIARTGGIRDILHGTVQIWQPQDFGVLKSIAGNLDAFEQVLVDSEVQSALAQRRLAIVSKDWNVDPFSDASEDVAAAEHMREILKALNWDDINDKMHYGIFYGFSVAELMYEIKDNRITVAEILVRNRRRFRFGRDHELRLLTRNHPTFGEVMHEGKFWTFATGGDNHDNPYGIGLAHWLYWPTYFKTNGVRFWMIFLDKFAMPTATAKHDFGDDPVKVGKLLEILEAIHTDSGVAIPRAVEIELLEAKRSGTTDYETLAGYMDKAIQKVTIGQVASSEGTPGKLGNENLQAEVRHDIIKADADLICESWNRGPGRWLTAWNFPNANPPRVWRDVEPPEDLKEKAEVDKLLADIGFVPSLDHVTETYGEGYEAKPPPVQANPFGDPFRDPDEDDPEFTAHPVLPPENALKLALDALLEGNEELLKQSGQVIAPVFRLVNRVGPEIALGRLSELYPGISTTQFTEALARANFVAAILGRLVA